MLRRLASSLAPLFVCIVTAACGGSADVPSGPSPTPTPSPTDPTTPPPSPAGCSVSVTELPGSVPADAGRYPFSIVIGSSCEWRAQSDAAWADIAPGSGRGNATLTLTVEQNTRPDDSRTATVLVNGTPFRVTQNRLSCSYAVDPTSLDQGAGGGNVRVSVTTKDTCPWTATAGERWIHVLTPSGTGSAVVSIDLESNSGARRQGLLTIAGLRVGVFQHGD